MNRRLLILAAVAVLAVVAIPFTSKPATAVGTGTGLLGRYFDYNNGYDFSWLKCSRTDPTVNFVWPAGQSPNCPAVGIDFYLARWTGQVQPLYTETYTFYTYSDDGVRVWVNNQLIVDNWSNHAPTENSGTIALTANQKYSIQIDYHNDGWEGDMKLSWSSSHQAKQIIPQTQLYNTDDTATGLRASYFDDLPFQTWKTDHVDSQINFNWGGSPGYGIASTTFSMRWNGTIQPLYSQTYTFYTTSNDGVRLRINNQLVIENWTDHGATVNSGTIALTAGVRYPIQLDFYNNAAGAQIKLEWQSASQARQVVPRAQLKPTGGSPNAPVHIQEIYPQDGHGTNPDPQWNYATHTIADIRRSAVDGYYDVWLYDEDYTNQRALTDGNPLLPGKHVGNPFWLPNGNYLAMSVEKAIHGGSSDDALPGFGGYSDIWIMKADGTQAWQMTNVPDDYDNGAMFPRFNHAGNKLMWLERVVAPNAFDPIYIAGAWVIKIADFSFDGGGNPVLSNTVTYRPGNVDAFNEATAWSADDTKIIFASNWETRDFWKDQIYTLTLATGAYTNLTNDANYHEHPYYTPDGKTVIWMTTKEADSQWGIVGCDWWLMNPDGSNKRRLTFFEKVGHTQNDGGARWPGSMAWSPDGSWFYGGEQMNVVTQEGRLIKVTMD